jgi:hypothetical protein
MRRVHLIGGLAAAAIAIVVPSVGAAGQAVASGPGANTLVPVRSGITAAALPGARVTGNTPQQTLETVSFILRERKLRQLPEPDQACRRLHRPPQALRAASAQA